MHCLVNKIQYNTIQYKLVTNCVTQSKSFKFFSNSYKFNIIQYMYKLFTNCVTQSKSFKFFLNSYKFNIIHYKLVANCPTQA